MTGPDTPSASGRAGWMAELPHRYPSSLLINGSEKIDQHRAEKTRIDISPLPPSPTPESASVPASYLHLYGWELPYFSSHHKVQHSLIPLSHGNHSESYT